MSAGRLAQEESDQKRSDPQGIAPFVSEMGSNPCGKPHGSEFQLRACRDGFETLTALAAELEKKLVVHDGWDWMCLLTCGEENQSSIDIPNAGCDGFNDLAGLATELGEELVIHGAGFLVSNVEVGESTGGQILLDAGEYRFDDLAGLTAELVEELVVHDFAFGWFLRLVLAVGWGYRG